MATPGPWVSDGIEVYGDKRCVADCCPEFHPPSSQQANNAALLAHFRNVGPELVEALESFVNACDHAPPVELVRRIGDACEKARAALSRAKEVEFP